MATSRRASSALNFGSDFSYEYCCDLCEGEGQQKEAVGYCSNCREYLCTDCFRHHKRPKPMRNHVLLDQNQMPKSQRTRGTDSRSSILKGGSDFLYEYCCDLCEGEGQQKEAVGYCSNCREYLCTDCFRHHKRPKPMRNHVLLDQNQMPKSQRTRGTDSRSSILKGGSDFVYEYCCGLCEGEGQQKEAVGYCSNCREYLCTDCFRHHKRPKPMRNHVLLDQNQMPKDNETPTSSRSVTVSDVEARIFRVPDVRKTYSHHILDVRVKHGDDCNEPNIKGCAVLSRDKLVLVDGDNNSVKLAKLTRGHVVAQLKLSDFIWGITQVSSSQVAVTSGQTICFINVGDQLKLDRKITVNGQCQGIARIGANLVVSYDDPVKVEIISLKGKVVQTVVTEDKGGELFTYPWYIAVGKDQQTVYISDPGRNTVTSVDLTGRVNATYEDDKLKEPRGITVDTEGEVYICGYRPSSIFQLKADLTDGQQLFQHSDGVEWPTSICYCETMDRLYVGMFESDVVKVFQLK